jgi:hypothetical protein
MLTVEHQAIMNPHYLFPVAQILFVQFLRNDHLFFSPPLPSFLHLLSVSFGLSVSSFLAERPVWHPIFYDGQK